MSMLKNAAVIPVRGGSKGIPRKNLLLHNNKPLLVNVIEAALASSVQHVIVSTDDDEMALVASKAGAEVMRQPAAISGDLSDDLIVFDWLLRQAAIEQLCLDYIVHLRATFPDIEPVVIDKAIHQFEHAYDEYDSLRSVVRATQSPYKTWFIDGSGQLAPVVPGHALHSMPRQLIPPAYWQNAAVDVFKVATVLEKGSMVGRSVMPFVMQADDGVDIDTYDDYLRLKRRT